MFLLFKRTTVCILLVCVSCFNVANTVWGITLRDDFVQGYLPNDFNKDFFVENDNDELQETGRFDFLMPNVSPQQPELYLCSPIKVDYTTNYYIIGYEPNATMNTAHHMLLYGCGEPGMKSSVWNCGEMSKHSKEKTAPPCDGSSHSQILYAWARDAPPLNLPKGVGFKVGRDSSIKYLILQVHYARVDRFVNGASDNSGVLIKYTTVPLTKLAGVLLLGTSGQIPPMKTEHMETACFINEKKVLHPFAFRTHTHSLGKVVSGYRVRADKNNEQQWTLLGKKDPMKPQMFYPILNNETIKYGDAVAARCTMKSTRNRVTLIGATAEDEMCNFYLMYYVENDEPLTMKYCYSQGPPYYYWRLSDTGLNNIPDEDASKLA